MYREMTAEEKLQYSSEIIEALKAGGFISSLEVIEKYKKVLSNDNISNEVPKAKTPDISDESVGHILSSNKIPVSEPVVASIYAEEHIPAVQEDLTEQRQNVIAPETSSQYKTKILRNDAIPSSISTSTEAPTRPNPWTDAKTVVPGEVKDILTR